MRRILAGVALAFLSLTIGAGLMLSLTAATPVFSPVYDPLANDIYDAADPVNSTGTFIDTIVPDGLWNYSVTVQTPSDDGVAGVYVKLSPSGGPANTGWMLLRDEVGIYTWATPVDSVFLKGGGAADTTGITRYSIWIVQNRMDN